jgi:hypothetical protein
MYHVKYSCVLTATYVVLLVLNKHNGDDSAQSYVRALIVGGRAAGARRLPLTFVYSRMQLCPCLRLLRMTALHNT